MDMNQFWLIIISYMVYHVNKAALYAGTFLIFSYSANENKMEFVHSIIKYIHGYSK